MEDFISKYISDSKEMVSSLMEDIIKLESNKADKKLIDQIFRVLHTLKGSAAMFGLEKVGKISHHFENIFESIRSGELAVNQTIIDKSLVAVDIIQKLLESNEKLSENDLLKFEEFIAQTADINDLNNKIDSHSQSQQEYVQDFKIYFISFCPKSNVLKRGIKPFDVFEELLENGVYRSFPFTDKINDLENIDVTDFLLYWEIFFLSKLELNQVKDIFMFYYDNEYEISEININDFFKNDELFIKFKIITEGNTSILKLQEIIKDLLKSKSVNFVVSNSEAKKSAQIIENTHEIFPENKIVDSIRVSSYKLDELINLVSELVTLNSGLDIIAKETGNELLQKKILEISKLSKKFRDNALELRLIPVNILMVKLKRLVRDLSLKLNKNIEFIVEGAETQLDKNIIDKIEAPLMHILRNSIDHGIETEEERRQNNKPDKGMVRFIAFYSGANVFIQIQDDGRGIDLEKIRKKAIEKSMITENQPVTEKELIDFIFNSGFSTALSLTEVSGRGVGMDVVRKQIHDLRGEIDVTSELKLGTSVTLKLPLTLSIIDTLLISVAFWKILIPLYPVIVCKRVKFSDKSKIDRIEFQNQLIPVIDITKIFPAELDFNEFKQVVIFNINEKNYGLLIDKVLCEHQAVIKPLGHLHQNQNYLSGASILGDGSIIPVLDLNSLTKYYFSNKNI